MEENRKGNTLYAVLGVATLVVAIIGATFAYFSASATATGEIKGGTSDIGSALTLTVTRELFGAEEPTDEEGKKFENLVPANLDISTDANAKANIANALNNKCIANGYTGCHLYKITATSAQTLEAADVLLNSFATAGVTDKASWKFVVFTATESTAETATTYTVNRIITGTTPENFSTSDAVKTGANEGYNINKDEDGENDGMTAATDKVFYLLVYLEDNDKVQNPGAEDTANAQYSAVGSYSGSVIFNAAGGKVVANFNTTTPIGGE